MDETDEKRIVAVGVPVYVSLGDIEPMHVGTFEIRVGEDLKKPIAEALEAFALELRGAPNDVSDLTD